MRTMYSTGSLLITGVAVWALVSSVSAEGSRVSRAKAKADEQFAKATSNG